MAADGAQQDANGTEFQVHQRNYLGFLTILKRSMVGVAIITALVIYLISR